MSLSLNKRLTTLENTSGSGTGTTTIADVENLQTTLDTKQETLTAGDNITIVDNVISSSGGGSGTTTIADVENLQSTLDTKQETLTAGDNIAIVDNVISSSGGGSSSFVGFRAAGDGTFSLTVAFGQTISTKMKIYDNQANSTFDTEGTYASGSYTIPTGYSGWWEVNIKIYMLGYSEGTAMVALRQNSTSILNSGDYQGQRGDFSSFVQLNEGDVMYIRQEQNSGQYSFFANRSWWQMRFIASSL